MLDPRELIAGRVILRKSITLYVSPKKYSLIKWNYLNTQFGNSWIKINDEEATIWKNANLQNRKEKFKLHVFPIEKRMQPAEMVKIMIKNKYGRIINISTVTGLMGNPGQVNYSSSKAA